MTNLVPALTFILAILFRMEKLGIKCMAGRAKIFGTTLGVIGAMVLTFYKGFEINIWPSIANASHFTHAASSHSSHDGNIVLGSLLSLASTLSIASWLIIQAKVSENYPCYYSSTCLMNIMGGIQACVFALITDHKWEHWKLGWNIRLLTVTYTGIFGSGMCIALLSWCVKLKGPVYVSIFNPLSLILVAIAGSLILDEKLHLGSILGGAIIVLGLYAVLWGKSRESKRLNKLTPAIVQDTSLTGGESRKMESRNGSDSNHPRRQDVSVAIGVDSPFNKELD